jgi:hypothetical protein
MKLLIWAARGRRKIENALNLLTWHIQLRENRWSEEPVTGFFSPGLLTTQRWGPPPTGVDAASLDHVSFSRLKKVSHHTGT